MPSTNKTLSGLNLWEPTDKPMREDFNADNRLLEQLISPAPTGAIMQYAAATAPAGWLLCQGQQVSRTTYAKLFSVIGTTYGSGNGSTTFTLPDMRGRVALGFDANLGLGGVKGTATHNHTGFDGDISLSIAQLPAHCHNGLIIDSTHLTWAEVTGSGALFPLTGSTGQMQDRIRTGDTGNGQAHRHTIGADSNYQPSLALAYIIKT